MRTSMVPSTDTPDLRSRFKTADARRFFSRVHRRSGSGLSCARGVPKRMKSREIERVATQSGAATEGSGHAPRPGMWFGSPLRVSRADAGEYFRSSRSCAVAHPVTHENGVRDRPPLGARASRPPLCSTLPIPGLLRAGRARSQGLFSEQPPMRRGAPNDP